MTQRERNYRKHPHTARFLMTFHTAGGTNPGGGGNARERKPVVDMWEAANAFPVPSEPVIEDRRSPRQAELMTSLLNELSGLDEKAHEIARHFVSKMTENGEWTPGRDGNASMFITETIAQIKRLRSERRVVEQKAARLLSIELTDGMYVLGERIIKAQYAKQGSGNLYAKELINGAFQYVPGLVRELRNARRMTLEEAKTYGKLYGICCVCGRDLTDESSIEAGIGPICAGKF